MPKKVADFRHAYSSSLFQVQRFDLPAEVFIRQNYYNYNSSSSSSSSSSYYYYYYYYYTKHFLRLTSTTAGAESDLNARQMETHQSSPRAISFKVVEWSEQLRSVTSVWLGAAAAAFKSDSAPAGV